LAPATSEPCNGTCDWQAPKGGCHGSSSDLFSISGFPVLAGLLRLRVETDQLQSPDDDAAAEGAPPRLRQDRLGAFRAGYTSAWQHPRDALPTKLFGPTMPQTSAHQVAHCERVSAGSSTNCNDADEDHQWMHRPDTAACTAVGARSSTPQLRVA
jgi:hypothetical protein